MRRDLPPQTWASEPRSMPLVASFFSGGFYEREAFELMRSCQSHYLDFEIVELPDLGDWLENVNRKPRFLLDVSRRNPRRSILWLDADARVRRYPALLRTVDAVVAYHKIAEELPCDATVLLGRDRVQREAFLEEWIRLVSADPLGAQLPRVQAAVGAPAQFYFELAIQRLKLPAQLLPADYCWIFDFAKDREGAPADPHRVPVIEQMQANRWAKKLARVPS